MELLFSSIIIILLAFIFFTFFLVLRVFFYHNQHGSPVLNLPPGRTGWPVVGENPEFLLTAWRGNPKKFVLDRMLKYSPECFKTSIVGQTMVFFCGPSGNKFLFSNEGKLVKTWWPDSLRKIFPDNIQTNGPDAALKLKKLVPQFLKAEPLQRLIGTMDAITQTRLASSWEGKDRVFAFPSAKNYTFWVACRLFLSMEDPDHVAHLLNPFKLVTSGIISVPIDLPGTRFKKAIRAAKYLKEKFEEIVKQKKIDLAMQKSEQPNNKQDLLTCLLSSADANGEYLSDSMVSEAIMGLLIAGYDSVSSIITLIIKYLAELPHVYHAVYTEQMEIAKGKAEGELLNKDDIQKMKYSWNVACEVMRLMPPAPGLFKEAITDFTYAGFTIPKGWKLYWSAHSTNSNPQYFPNPEKFDPTRFEGGGPAPFTYVPFGGGPHMCPGREYSRLVILVFMHNVVKRYRWELIVKDEQIRVSPFPVPVKGLPIRLIPHQIMGDKQD